jgi:4-amino-4-deoxy-L-arabinose transferase-like glycosyltransferase
MNHTDNRRPIETATRDCLPAGAKRATDYALAYLALATVGLFVAWIRVIPIRSFDPDEFEHSHAAWYVSKGMLPYKDFFEHHSPWYYYTLAPFFRWFNVDLSVENSRHFLLFGRGFSIFVTVLSVIVVVLIGRVWQDRKVGLLAALFLVAQPVFFEKSIEMRPDVLALPFFLLCLLFLLRGLSKTGDPAVGRVAWFLAGGLGLGAAIMCTQKMLFVMPGLLSGLGIWVLFAGPKRYSRILSVASFLGGIGIPVTLTWAAFALHQGGREFLVNNFALNAGWRQVVNEQLLKVLETSWPVLLLCLLGSCAALYPFFRTKQRQYDAFVLLSTLLGLIAGIIVVPVAHRQYYLMLLPLVCLFAAKGLCFLIELAQERTQAWLFIVATIPLFILPALDLREAFTQRNDHQLARLREVFEKTKPTDVVMDGWEGTGVFRPHAFYYFFLHEESVPMLPQKQVDDYLDALENGTIRPRLIAMDDNLVALGSRFVRFVKKNYVSSDGFFYFSKNGSN